MGIHFVSLLIYFYTLQILRSQHEHRGNALKERCQDMQPHKKQSKFKALMKNTVIVNEGNVTIKPKGEDRILHWH